MEARDISERLTAERRLLDELPGYSGEWIAFQSGPPVTPTRHALRKSLSLKDMGAYFEVSDEIIVAGRRVRRSSRTRVIDS